MPTPPALASTLMVGSVELPNRLFVAPMAGVTNYPFRALCKRFGLLSNRPRASTLWLEEGLAGPLASSLGPGTSPSTATRRAR